MRTLIFIFCIVLLAACGGSDTPSQGGPAPRAAAVSKPHPQKAGLQYPVLLARRLFTQYDDALGRIGDSLCVGTYKGVIMMSDTARKQQSKLVDLKSEFLVDKMFVQLLGNDVLVFWQETDHEGARSYAARFHRGSDKPVWKNKYTVPNLGQPVIDGDVGYLTARGLIARFRLGDGKADWQCDTLYHPNKNIFLEFEKPRVYDSVVVFKEKVKNNQFRRADSIKVMAADGRLR